MKLPIIISLITSWMWSCHAQKSNVVQSNPIESKTLVPADSLNSSFTLDYLMGKFDPASHPDFVVIPAKYRDEEVRYLRKDVLDAFINMYDAASKVGIQLIIKSATRNFDNQKRIWEKKWTGKTILDGGINAMVDIPDEKKRALKILEYSSMPGTSRHHWGTDFDLNQFTNEWFENGEGLKIYTWLKANAASFGFCQPYSQYGSDRNSGYFEEKWHWTYLPISTQLTQLAQKSLRDNMITGFLGCETAKNIGVVEKYILGISPQCVTTPTHNE